MELTKEEKKILLKAARNTIRRLFENIEIERPDYKEYPVLESKAGAFVTLTILGRLRGCIGYIIGEQPVFETVCDAAVNAAMHDPRFHPLTKKEFDKVHIEISILSEPFPMNSYDDIVIGKHGLILEEKGRRGLLLPQVPVEHNMSRNEYLGAICQKSGFPSDYWKGKTLNMSMFTATVFDESELEY